MEDLNDAQRAAVEHGDGPLLVLAGPGSGKTRVVTRRIVRLMERGAAPQAILALTFTNKAADEMKRRVQALAPGCHVWVSTFHRFGARLLREHAALAGLSPNFTIYDADDARSTLRRAMESAGIQAAKASPDRIASAISQAKNQLITPENFRPRRGSFVSEIAAEAYPVYQARLLANSAVDFDDLLLHVALLLRDNPELRQALDARFRYVLVDEYQDTNHAQYEILRGLAVDHPNVTATGDPDQSIYGWRGADIKNILQFEADFRGAQVVRLEQNYRSTPNILSVADELIGHNVRRKRKALFTHRPAGLPVRLARYADEKAEARGIVEAIRGRIAEGRRPSEFAVFYRINALSRTLEKEFRRGGIPFQMVRGVEFLQRREVKDVLAYCQLINNPRDETALLRVVNTPPRGIGRKTIDLLAEHAARRGETLLDAVHGARGTPGLGARAVKSLEAFSALIRRLSDADQGSVSGLIEEILQRSGYREFVQQEDSEEGASRLANVEELLTDARQFDEDYGSEGSLELYLEKTWLVNDVDDWEGDADKVTLMTLHAAKGLEFPVVFIVALEQGILPHERSREDLEQLEEERRLLFVGITRAADELQLSFTGRREFRGRSLSSIPSDFLLEVPRDALELRIDQPAFDDADAGDAMAFDDAHGDDFSPGDDFPPEDFVQVRRDASISAAAAPARDRRPAPPPRPALPALTTAAQLAGVPVETRPAGPQRHPESFAEGMIVSHPVHGPGKIVGLSGTGAKRQATVRFAAAGERKFVLIYSDLRPVDAGD
jgi:DNA helicase-2/ATP-dependent DNA helicase PcrA